MRQRGEGPARQRVVAAPHTLRILVVANETVEGEELLDAIRARAEGGTAEVYVVTPGAQLEASPLDVRRGRRA